MLSSSRRPATPKPCGNCGSATCTGNCHRKHPTASHHTVWMAAAVAGFAMGATLLTAFGTIQAQSAKPAVANTTNAAIITEIRKLGTRLDRLEEQVKGGFSNCRAEAKMCVSDRDQDGAPDCVEQCKESSGVDDEAFKKCIDAFCRKPEGPRETQDRSSEDENRSCVNTCEQSYVQCKSGVETDEGVMKCKTSLTTCVRTCKE